jgi:DNA processing protein
MPGSPGDPRTKGTNGLIRDGAILTENAGDVLQVLAEAELHASRRQFSFDFKVLKDISPQDNDIDIARDTIIELLDFAPIAVDELVRNCQFSIAVVNAVVFELELAGRLERHPGNKVSLLREL